MNSVEYFREKIQELIDKLEDPEYGNFTYEDIIEALTSILDDEPGLWFTDKGTRKRV